MKKLLFISFLTIFLINCSNDEDEVCEGTPEILGQVQGVTNIGVEITLNGKDLCEENISFYAIKIGGTETEIISIKNINGVSRITFKVLPNTTTGAVTFHYNNKSTNIGFLEIV